MTPLTSWLSPRSADDATFLFVGDDSQRRDLAAKCRDYVPLPDTLFGYPVRVEADSPTSD